MTAHKHKDVIVAWANGEHIQYKSKNHSGWMDMPKDSYSSWSDGVEYRIKPAAPTVYLDNEEVHRLAEYYGLKVGLVEMISQETLKSALKSQQVVLMSEVQDIARELNKSLREKEKMAVAERTALAYKELVSGYSIGCAHYASGGINLRAICASVKLP